MTYLTRGIGDSFAGLLARPADDIKKMEIDTLRGFAVLAVVWHHSMLEYVNVLQETNMLSALAELLIKMPTVLLDPLRMPLFTILSGWVYALRPASKDSSFIFIKGKLRRIILPLMFVSMTMYVSYFLLNGSYPVLNIGGQPTEVMPQDAWMVFFYHFGHLWFLHAVFAIFMFILVVDSLNLMNSVRRWCGWLVVLAVAPFVLPSTEFWSVFGVLHLSVFFVFGLGLYRFRDILFQPRVVLCGAVVFAFGMTMYVLSKLGGIDISDTSVRVVRMFVGISGALCLLSLRLRLSWLAWLGGFSYTIYLYHPLAFQLHRTFDSMLSSGAVTQLLWFAMLFLCGVLIPIVIDKVFSNTKLLKTPILGKKASLGS